ncbi:DUF4242 domain-containing protein [Lysinibacillus sphaericus]|uniref:DUF4242 domain-containing protein n=1 Tax=Lysinibacillus sphaericus TaxID=1421 RepID=A0A2S0K4J7_LYSSH|nr:DUF4242 domain-containing protein [Lysinibacillus sphaericus]AVK98258.1 hypothetical protein LS41612_19100 [Lysinibacillus sphaericus]MED4543770.1 DUF4242 domain-containing protein [Lysinibacillus sphaericus]TKI17227.1 DUF4242 domain-containing protein [Lysinibacillus sphaericus]SUV15782.1 Uncharacterised protein [Lysinibacillus sphaericus]GEC81016.1 hypothetical protein LSP03_07590 [Lysinibacillus sphaericus]
MSLFLVESTVSEVSNKEQFAALVERVGQAQEVTVIEVQVAKDFSRAYFILEANKEAQATSALTAQNIQIDLVKEVRLVGKELDEVKTNQEVVNYLVEWEIPAEITMDQYLARKKKNSVHYEEVPEVHFSRTYVCEDMTKCLCFYDAPDEAAVKRAREAVQTPITSLTELADK